MKDETKKVMEDYIKQLSEQNKALFMARQRLHGAYDCSIGLPCPSNADEHYIEGYNMEYSREQALDAQILLSEDFDYVQH